MQIQTAVREKTHTLISIAGASGSGKTLSSIFMPRGIVGPKGKIGLIDTENKRSRFYSNVAGGFDVIDITPPFAPARYVEAIKTFEDAGYHAVVVDSISHEWDGLGGVVEMADDIEQRTGKPGLHCWKKPKLEHKRLMNVLLQTQMHIIFSCRAKVKVEQGKDDKGKSVIVNAGYVPIVEKSFIYEMTVSCLLDPATHVPILTKCPYDLRPAFPENKRIGEATGELIRKWADDGVDIDINKVKLFEQAREVAREGSTEFADWWKELTKAQRSQVTEIQDELASIRDAADEQAKMGEQIVTDDYGEITQRPPKDIREDEMLDL